MYASFLRLYEALSWLRLCKCSDCFCLRWDDYREPPSSTPSLERIDLLDF